MQKTGAEEIVNALGFNPFLILNVNRSGIEA
jgi:hypothetical protein